MVSGKTWKETHFPFLFPPSPPPLVYITKIECSAAAAAAGGTKKVKRELRCRLHTLQNSLKGISFVRSFVTRVFPQYIRTTILRISFLGKWLCGAEIYCEWGVVHSITFHRGAQKGRLFLPAYAHAHSRIVYYIAGWGRAPPRELNYMYYGTTAVKYLRAPRHAHTARM